jgi:hypothetical protein
MTMKPAILQPTLLLLLISAVAAPASTEERLSHSFSVQPGGTIILEVDFGAISISTNANNEVAVDVWRKIGRRKKADEEAYLREHPVTFTQDGNTVTIRSRGKSGRSWSVSGRNLNDAKYTISVPARFSARLKTGGGGVAVADLTGDVRAETGGGGLDFARLHGPVVGETGGGGVKAAACEGTLKLHTGGGGLEVTGGGGSLEGLAGGGPVTVKEFQGPVRARTGGGGLRIEKVDGSVEASTGGGSVTAVLGSEVPNPVKLSTGGGGIAVDVPAHAAFNLDAQTGGGSVSTELPVTVTGKLEPGRLRGPVNGGGKTVELRSGGGSIHLNKL